MNPAFILLVILIVAVFVLFGSSLSKPLGRLIKGETKKWKEAMEDDEEDKPVVDSGEVEPNDYNLPF